MKRLLSFILASLVALQLSACVPSTGGDESSCIASDRESNFLNDTDLNNDDLTDDFTEPSEYYEMIVVKERDIKDTFFLEALSAYYIDSASVLSEIIESSAMSSVKTDIFDENLVYLVNTSYEKVVGFKKLMPASEKLMITCEILDNNSSRVENLTEQDNLYYIVLVPKSEMMFNYHYSNPEVNFIAKASYNSIRFKSNIEISENQEPKILYDNDELKRFCDSYGFGRYTEISRKEYFYIAFYERTERKNVINSIYKNAEIDETGQLKIDLDVYYENQKGHEYLSNSIYIVAIPLNCQTEMNSIILNRSEKIIKVSKLKNYQYDDYLMLLDIQYREEAEQTKDVYRIIDSVEEYEKESKNTLDSYAASRYKELFEKYYALMISTFIEDSDKDITGVKDLYIEQNTIRATVVEHQARLREGKYTRVVYVLIPRDELLGYEARMLNIEIKTTEIDYYDYVGEASIVAGSYPNYTTKKEKAYLVDSFEEFKALWKDYASEAVINSVSEKSFENHMILAIYRYKGSSADYNLGYHSFYIDSEGIHITLDEGITYIGNEMIYEWYDLILVPRELIFGIDCDNIKIDVNFNSIHRQYNESYW